MRILLLATAAALTGCAMNEEPQPVARAGSAPVAILQAPDGSARGTVRLLQAHGEILLNVQAENLPPGAHGAHIHAVGRCDAPDFTSAGPHWNPTGRQHGQENPAGPHMGDTPNITIGANGRGSMESRVPGGWVRNGPTPVLDADGAAFVIHASADDNRTDPSGNSGARIACAVLR